MLQNIKAVIFDVDNTLIDRTTCIYQAFRYYYKNVAKLDVDTITFEALVQDSVIWDQQGTHNKKFVIENANRDYHLNINVEDFMQWYRDYSHEFSKLFPDTMETLNYLKDKYKLGIITNGFSKTQHMKITSNHLETYFDTIIVSDDYGTQKPEKKIFEIALEKMSVKPHEAVYVGDIYSKDVFGATKAGLIPIWINRGYLCGDFDNVIKITTIGQLKNIL